MPEPKLIDSPLRAPLKKTVRRSKFSFIVSKMKLWDRTLEIVSSDGCSTVREEPFSSDEEALAEALSAIKDDGIKSFSEGGVAKSAMH